MKKWMILGGISLLFIAGLSYYFLTQFRVVNAGEGNEEAIVLANKVWSIQFTEKVAKESLHSDSIYVLDDQGKKVKTSLSLSGDQKTVYINPPKDGYPLDAKFFTLYFNKGLESSAGRNLGSNKSWKFVVKEQLPVIGSKEKLNAYFNNLLKEEKTSRRWFKSDTQESAMSGEKSSADSSKNDGYSETNNQVQGVDEADIVKTDGKHIFQAEENEIRIIKAVPEDEMKLVSKISYPSKFMPNQLFLHEGKLAVIGNQYHHPSKPYEQTVKESKILPMMMSTKAVIYDVKNPAKPVLIREVELEGSYMSARKVESMIYLVTVHYPDYWLLRENEVLDIRPKYSDTASGPFEKIVSYDEINYFPESKESNFTMIAAIDFDQPKEKAAITTYLGSGEQMYMSKENLYLAIANWADHPRGNWTERIAPDTTIHKFSIKGMDVKFQGSALVQGTVLNQFSMDEHDGFFRVVTTKGYAWDESRPSSNALYILDENLKPTGKLESLARGERIYSARFMENRIYMVTFKETDPLFVIEASDPAKPKVMGELKIPGFSNYLHPYDENHLIGFGHDTKIVAEKGAGAQPRILTDGVKISLFDVSDMHNPKEKFTEIIGGRGTYSPLNYDHKALLFNKDKNVFAFPISVYQNSKENEYDQIFEYQGAYVYSIDSEKGFVLKAEITHNDNGHPSVYEEYDGAIKRLLYIGDTIYALSPGKLTSHDLKSYSKTGTVDLR
ncbi:beta-propeller domain-containing protein [Bacillus sp. B-jedd]|uniref:beta-propeller domain-containing protein n=1 Tax=Bacillus sp. B-jedd TaxID=1476857 RepID=UPI000515569C|nr:beta-propeller domain-containing protein [Bacillus sp. B-jedd]CEG26361.1 Beta propeller domain protein [Bacillus sp. B-jedd]